MTDEASLAKEPWWFAIDKETLRLVEVAAGTPGAVAFDLRDANASILRQPAEPTRSQKLREAGFTRRPSWKSLPKDGDEDPCRWYQEEEESHMYNTACSQVFMVSEDCDPPLGAWMKFCCYCGKPLQEVPWEPEEEKEE